ncbi:hypothetical protein [Nocardia harenae]|uniref:hypothetical protein n=1 Tax=Nocardia harenae TaxID=358707 RepID=UPI0012ECD45E|nr:hypothetical protein [Nocardia harenae]
MVGGLVGALAVAAHGAAGGGVPGGADFALLQAVSILTGAVAVLVRRPGRFADAAGLLAVLAGGQYATHLLLASHLGPATSGHIGAAAHGDLGVAAESHFGAADGGDIGSISDIGADAGAAAQLLGLSGGAAAMAGAHVLVTLLVALAIPAAERFAALAATTLRAMLGPPRPRPPRVVLAGFPGAPLLRAAGPLGAIGPRAPPVGR